MSWQCDHRLSKNQTKIYLSMWISNVHNQEIKEAKNKNETSQISYCFTRTNAKQNENCPNKRKYILHNSKTYLWTDFPCGTTMTEAHTFILIILTFTYGDQLLVDVHSDDRKSSSLEYQNCLILVEKSYNCQVTQICKMKVKLVSLCLEHNNKQYAVIYGHQTFVHAKHLQEQNRIFPNENPLCKSSEILFCFWASMKTCLKALIFYRFHSTNSITCSCYQLPIHLMSRTDNYKCEALSQWQVPDTSCLSHPATNDAPGSDTLQQSSVCKKVTVTKSYVENRSHCTINSYLSSAPI